MKNTKAGYLYSFISILLFSILTTAVSADTLYRVKKSDNLDKIVTKFYSESSLTKIQLMLAVFEKNGNAFKAGNINFLKSGVELILPDENNLLVYSQDDAKETLKQYKNNQGSDTDFSLSELIKSIQNEEIKESTKKATENQQKQSQKINKLKKEGDELRKQLEQLVSEKAVRDKKLAELEVAIKSSLKSSLGGANKVDVQQQQSQQQIDVSNKKNIVPDIDTSQLKKTNEKLQIELKKSRSKLAESSLSAASMERKINDLQNQSALSQRKGQDNKSSVSLDTSKSLSSNDSSLNTKVILLILLLLGLWYFLNKKWGKKAVSRNNVDDDSNLSEVLSRSNMNTVSSESIDLNYQNTSIESDIKLDVAKAYIEMSDTESALKILDEVVESGSEKLQKEARTLLESIA